MTDRPALGQALRNQFTERMAAGQAQEDRRKQLEADAELYGTPGWDALPEGRRRLVAAHVRRAHQQGADDAA
jgi:hypothetical protein